MANLTVAPRPHWVNAWLLRTAARPYLRLDGAEHALDWGQACTLPITPGTHVLQTFWRYRGFRLALGTGTLQLTVRTGEDVLVLARNGPLNHQPLQPRQVYEPANGS